MQPAPFDFAKSFHQPAQDDNQQTSGDTHGTTPNTPGGRKNSVSDTEQKIVKVPAMVSKPVTDHPIAIQSETKKTDIPLSPRGGRPLPPLPLSAIKNPDTYQSPRGDKPLPPLPPSEIKKTTTPQPTLGEKSVPRLPLSEAKKTDIPQSPRGAKPLPRLQLLETPVKDQQSPRSPRTDISQGKTENATAQSARKGDIIKFADSVIDAYGAFNSPRGSQPRPRKLPSNRELNAELTPKTASQIQKTLNSSVNTPVTTTGTATITSTTTAKTQTADVPPVQQTPVSGALPDEPGYQPGEFFIKARRRLSMPASPAPKDHVPPSPSAHPLPLVKYSKDSQMNVLADMVVAECTKKPINPQDLGCIGRIDSNIKLDELPPELAEFKGKLKTHKKPGTHHLMHDLFWPDIKSSSAWESAKAIDQKVSRANLSGMLGIDGVNEKFKKHLESMMAPIAESFASCLFVQPITLATLAMPEDLKAFLCAADEKFVAALKAQDDRAAKGEKGAYPLSVKNIEQLRAYFLSHLLVTRILQPILVETNQGSTDTEATLLSQQMLAMKKATVELSKDFQLRSFAKYPDHLKQWLIDKSASELQKATVERGKSRFLALKTKASQRHIRSLSDGGAEQKENPLEAIARARLQEKKQRKQIDEQLSKIAGDLGIQEFPRTLAEKISSVKMTWIGNNDTIMPHEVMTHLLKTVRELIIETKNADAELMALETRLTALSRKDMQLRAQQRATMPVSLGDLDFLNAILEFDNTTTTNDTNTNTTATSVASTVHATATVNTEGTVTATATLSMPSPSAVAPKSDRSDSDA